MDSDAGTVAEFQARLQALKLRQTGMPYPWIAVAMREYHGIDRNAESWRYFCRKQGAPGVSHGRPHFQLRHAPDVTRSLLAPGRERAA